MSHRILSCLSALLLVGSVSEGCSKKVSWDTDLQLKPRVQRVSEAALEPLEQAVCYAFQQVDTAQWGVASYADALAGVLTAKYITGTRADGVKGTLLTTPGLETWLSMPVSAPFVMMVAVDTQNKLYGYTQVALAENLTPLVVDVVFYPWKDAPSYKVGNWWMFNKSYVVPDHSSILLHPTVQQTAEDQATDLSGAVAFAYPDADPAEWSPASYEDALVGLLTQKGSGQTRQDGIKGRTLTGEGRQAWLGLQVKTSTAMVLVVDTKNKHYGYAVLHTAAEFVPVEFAPLFQPWQKAAEYISGDWTMINKFYTPEVTP
ncbi:MAG: hypothetical protein RR330_01290 [Alistipes sp.]